MARIMRYLLVIVALVGISSKAKADSISEDASAQTGAGILSSGQTYFGGDETGSAIESSDAGPLPAEEYRPNCPKPNLGTLEDIYGLAGSSGGASNCGTASGSFELPTGGLVAIVIPKVTRSSIGSAYYSSENELPLPSFLVTGLFRPPRFSTEAMA